MALKAVEKAIAKFIDRWGGFHRDVSECYTLDNILDSRLCGLHVHVVDDENETVSGESFPLGSVVVTVHVRYTLKPPRGYSLSGPPNPEIIWSYQSCISGHKDICWKVASKDNYMDGRAAWYRARSEKDRQRLQDALKNGTR